MICLVGFRLRPGLPPDEYEEWFRREAVPAVQAMTSVQSYRVLRVANVLEGEPSFEFLELLEVADQALFERELEEVPEVKRMLEQWSERVTDPLLAYAQDVPQHAPVA